MKENWQVLHWSLSSIGSSHFGWKFGRIFYIHAKSQSYTYLLWSAIWNNKTLKESIKWNQRHLMSFITHWILISAYLFIFKHPGFCCLIIRLICSSCKRYTKFDAAYGRPWTTVCSFVETHGPCFLHVEKKVGTKDGKQGGIAYHHQSICKQGIWSNCEVTNDFKHADKNNTKH